MGDGILAEVLKKNVSIISFILHQVIDIIFIKGYLEGRKQEVGNIHAAKVLGAWIITIWISGEIITCRVGNYKKASPAVNETLHSADLVV